MTTAQLAKLEAELADLPERVQQAYAKAKAAHGDQKRRGSQEPYVVHPLRCVIWLWHCGIRNEAYLIAMVLHDCAEDTPYALAQIRRDWGDTVADLVAELTHGELGVEPTLSKREHLNEFRHATPAACLLKMVDRRDNMADPDDNPGRKHSYAVEAMRILVACLDNTRAKPAEPAFGHAWNITALRLNGAIQSQLVKEFEGRLP